ncbi:IS66 family insertion sequence element accessory protein TnpB [Bradyrhizobium sp. WU425]|uniref:IS66 family insertion sequence element accessory protein TnpB n=1 Tax=Bradyrhizobium sp. WU425 TaxID=187029 RepID=UPI001E38A029|nr:IS66 family insertion sequence element accessory protein TnpB [Bradyrhizobium canariense]UFW71392.1 IS66 family insertion sequence element accessory protein TnpB [Bradyrhizobium canariense]
MTIRASRGADAYTIPAIIQALKATGDQPNGRGSGVQVMMATKPIDFRREGLATLVRERMLADPFSGTVDVFRAKRADRILSFGMNGSVPVCEALGGRHLPLAEDRRHVMRLSAARMCP